MPGVLKSESSRQKYLDQFEILACSGIGVLMTHAREPNRVCEILHDWADAKRRLYKEWNVRDGWLEWDLPTKSKVVAKPDIEAGYQEANKALQRIQDVAHKGQNTWASGVFAMVYPHFTLEKNPAFMQCLKIYVAEFSKTKQRLVLIVPEDFLLPVELQNDIVVLDLELPKRDELRTVYEEVYGAAEDPKTVTKFNDDQIGLILSIGSGMTELEFEMAVGRAFITNEPSAPNTPLHDFTRVISNAKVEVVKRSEVLELMEPVPMEEVGGLDLYKEWIVRKKMCLTPEFQVFCNHKDVPKGCALIGPPGGGKSLIGKATASVLGVVFIRFDVSRVFASLVGQSEGRVRAALKLLSAMSPCVVMIDELDKAGLSANQGGGDAGTSRRVVGSILTFMQDSTDPIFWILTANRVRNLPSEMLRKGRLDEVFSVQCPNEIERREVFRIHLTLRNQKPEEIEDLEVAVRAGEGYLSAELEAAVKEAVEASFCSGEPVTGASIAVQFKTMKPYRIAFAEDFQEMVEWAENNAKPASSPEPVRIRSRNSLVTQPKEVGSK